MREIIKKYYELDDENKDLLYPMYLFHELENQLNEAETIDIYTIADEEKILNIAIDCSYITDLDGQEIIRRLLEILKCRDIEIDDILELTSEELKELILDINDKSNCNNDAIQVIKKFLYKKTNNKKNLYAPSMPRHTSIMETQVESMPVLRPQIMLVALPVVDCLAMLQSCR